MRQGWLLWWPVWPASSLSLASKGLFKVKFFEPPGSPSMPQGGPCLGSPGAESLRTSGAPSCAAHTPTRGVFCGTLCGPRLPSNGLSRGGQSCLCTPTVGASCGGDGSASRLHIHMPSFRGFHGGGSSWGLLHSAHFSLGSNTSGLAVVASTT